MHRLIFISIITSLLGGIPNVLGDGTITITDGPAYSSLLPCAQQCIYSQNLGCPNVPDPVGNAIGCYNNLNAGCQKVGWAMDSCYCRTDLQAAAVKTISKCVMSRCTIGDSGADVTSVENVYNGYCSAAGFVVNTAAAVASTTTATGLATSMSGNGASVPGQTAGTSSTSSSSTSASSPSATSSSSSSSLSTGAMIGIIVPVCSLAVSAIGIGVKIWSTKTKKKMHNESMYR